MTGTKSELALALRSRRGTDPQERTLAATPTEADTALFGGLIKDIKDNGLMLGHGTGKGFGWFEPV